MVESRVNFLIRGAAALSHIQSNETQQILKSYYLLRCKTLVGHYGLPQTCFSEKKRCPQCILEWKKEAEIKLNPIKLSKRQRKRIRAKRHKKNTLNKDYLLHSNEMERICSFCGHTSISAVQKPSKPLNHIDTHIQIKDKNDNTKILGRQNKQGNIQNKKDYQTDVYCKSNVAFSLCQESNTLPSLVTKPGKVIKNNKKKKDKFAGLCHTAVITALKLKHENESNNKLSLFLKPAA